MQFENRKIYKVNKLYGEHSYHRHHLTAIFAIIFSSLPLPLSFTRTTNSGGGGNARKTKGNHPFGFQARIFEKFVTVGAQMKDSSQVRYYVWCRGYNFILKFSLKAK